MRKILIKKGIIFLALVVFIGSIILPTSGNELKNNLTYGYFSKEVKNINREIFNGNLALGVCYDLDEEFNGIVAFNTDNPSNLTLIVPDLFPGFFSSCFVFPNYWYFSDLFNGVLYLLEIDTWELYEVGGGGFSPNDLAWDHLNNKMYGASSYDFYEIDPSTGAQTYIGGYGGGPDMIMGIGCDLDGTCYGIDPSQDKLWTIDTDTGYAKEVGPLGIDINYGNVAFDKENDQLFFTEEDSESSYLYTCDLETGEAILIGEFPSGISIQTFIIPYNWSNQHPDPHKIIGPNYGQPGVTYTFCIEIVDPEEDDIYFFWDWGDGETSGWIGPYASGEIKCLSHAWSEEGTYTIKIKLKDVYGAESDWVEHVIIIEAEPPELTILSPKLGIYLRNHKVLPFLAPIIFGEITISVNASDTLSGINHLDLYIDGTFKSNSTTSPCSWDWSERAFFRHEIKVLAYDNAGNNASKKIIVWKFF